VGDPATDAAHSNIIGNAAGFGVRELAPALESGGKPPHSKVYWESAFGAGLLGRHPDLQRLTNPDPFQLQKSPTVWGRNCCEIIFCGAPLRRNRRNRRRLQRKIRLREELSRLHAGGGAG